MIAKTSITRKRNPQNSEKVIKFVEGKGYSGRARV